MKLKEVNAEDLRPGMMLHQWTKQARKDQGRFQHLQQGPDGCWQGMVVANVIAEPRAVDGYAYPAVHQIDVFFWDEEGHTKFHSFFWTAGTHTPVID